MLWLHVYHFLQQHPEHRHHFLCHLLQGPVVEAESQGSVVVAVLGGNALVVPPRPDQHRNLKAAKMALAAGPVLVPPPPSQLPAVVAPVLAAAVAPAGLTIANAYLLL